VGDTPSARRAVTPPAGTQLIENNEGDVVFYSGTSWLTPQHIDGQTLEAVSCVSSTFCAVVDAAGGAATYDGSGWTFDATADPGYQLDSVSCVAAMWCMAAGANGSYGNLVDWDGTSWVVLGFSDPPPGGEEGAFGMTSVSCDPVYADGWCAAGDFYGNVFYGAESGWSPAMSIDSEGIYSLTCWAANQCRAVDPYGFVLTENSPTSWSLQSMAGVNTTIYTGVGPSISCAAASFCVTVDGQDLGGVYTFDGSFWSSTGPSGLLAVDAGYVPPSGSNSGVGTAVSCASPTFCVVVDGNDGNAYMGTG
jgi:hypothetical protein